MGKAEEQLPPPPLLMILPYRRSDTYDEPTSSENGAMVDGYLKFVRESRIMGGWVRRIVLGAVGGRLVVSEE
jgi:hypothetical protein